VEEMKKRIRIFGVLMSLVSLFVGALSLVQAEQELEGFTPLFDGQTLEGWRILKESSERWGKWEVVDGVIVGDQYPEGKGGLFVTTASYQDFELYAEVKADYPIDSGLFLRVQPQVLSYQVTIDYRPEGEVGAIYCPGGGGFLLHQPQGMDLWKADEFNRVRVKIWGQPAHIQVWINGKDVVDFQDSLVDGKPRVPESGFIGIQVHGGSSWKKGNKVYFRKLLVRPLHSP
jgi:hypothetical protein